MLLIKHDFFKEVKILNQIRLKSLWFCRILNVWKLEDKYSYLLTLRTYNIFGDSEIDWIIKKKDMKSFDKFVIYESKSGGKHAISYYRKLSTTEEIPIIIDKIHKYIKKHLGYKENTEYIQNTMHYYWINIYIFGM